MLLQLMLLRLMLPHDWIETEPRGAEPTNWLRVTTSVAETNTGKIKILRTKSENCQENTKRKKHK